MPEWVEVRFECVPLRSIVRLDAPLDATPKFAAFCARVKRAATKHGRHNAYYLHGGRCTFHLTNDPARGVVNFSFEGVALTTADDVRTAAVDVAVRLEGESCEWLTPAAVEWLGQSVSPAVQAEFDQYIASGDLQKTVARLRQVQALSDAQGGFLGVDI